MSLSTATGSKALNNLNFIVNHRELRVVIGPNGAGKTTLLDVISGKTKPAAGRVIFGKDRDLMGMRSMKLPNSASAGNSKRRRSTGI